MRTRVKAHAPRVHGRWQGGGDKEKGQAVWRGATGKGAQKRAAPMQTEPRVQPRRLVLPSAATRRLLLVKMLLMMMMMMTVLLLMLNVMVQ